jgi:unsaturated chondroitin disaccharide hydrolase
MMQMNRISIVLLGIAALISSCGKKVQSFDVDKELAKAMKQYEVMLAAHPDTTKIPHSLNHDGSYHDKPSEWWGSGFFGGTLWYLYEYSQDQKWKDVAHLWSMAVAKEQYNTTTHDLGFMVFCPFGKGYQLTGDSTYLNILMQGAKSLSTRFDANRGVIKSWDSFRDYDFPVIIDNMMNLDFLFWATKHSGDSSFYKLSVEHADVTMANHFRPDHSSYHVVCYDGSGKALAQVTHQGYSDSSAWARGQAWALYGYVVMFRETGDKKYLNHAMSIADFYLNHPNLPADKIPYWDFNAPKIPNEERDVSAAAIFSSGLLELQGYVDKETADRYVAEAREMLVNLSQKPYRTEYGEAGDFLLKHSVGHKPGSIEVDVPLIYADYYYIEALLRYKNLK